MKQYEQCLNDGIEKITILVCFVLILFAIREYALP